MLNLNLFCVEKGGDPELIRESQRSRGQPVELVDEVIALNTEWRQMQFEVDKIRQLLWRTSREIGKAKEDATELIQSSKEMKGRLAAKETEVLEAKSTLHANLGMIGDLVDATVPVSRDE